MKRSIVFDYSDLRGLIIARYGTYQAFAKKIGKSPQVVSAKLCGDRGMTRNDYGLWGAALDIGPEKYPAYFFKVTV